MTVAEMQEEIKKYKKENGVCVLAHAYQSHDIWEAADYVGDSFGLSRRAAEAKEQTVVMCGVRFMAETVKLLSPEKKVILSNPNAGCPMADQLDRELVMQLREANPGYAVAAYINTSAETKTVCDICVTSSSAVSIIRKMENDNILFLPDSSLGAYVAAQVPEKNIKTFRGGCPTHLRITEQDVAIMREKHPQALLLVHPECLPQVTASADYVGSTTGIMKYAEDSPAREFIIGTENSITEHLQFACPRKRFYSLSKDCVCHNMKANTLPEVLMCVKGEGGEVIELDGETVRLARRPLDEMLKYGG